MMKKLATVLLVAFILVMFPSCAWSGVSLQYDIGSLVFIMIAADALFEIIGISIFVYCFVKSARITPAEHKTAQYRKYQLLRILVLLLGVCCLLEAIHTVLSFSNCFDSIFQIISTAKDSIFGVAAATALWQIGILIHRLCHVLSHSFTLQ